MADNQAGIMALPDNQDMQKLSIFDSYDATNEALTAARPDAAGDISAEMQSLQGIADDLGDEELDAVIEAVQYLYENKEDYAKNIAELISGGAIEEGTFPAEYDPEFLATFNSILLEERKSRGTDQPPFPEKFARGGIADAARIVANQGRYGDTMLAHITPEEARMLRRQGGSGTINPTTGLPEYFNPLKAVVSLAKKVGSGISKAFKSVVSGVKKVLASPVGRIVATIALTAALGPVGTSWGLSAGMATSVGAGLASGAVTLAAGGNIKDAFKSAAFAAIAAPQGVVGSYVGPTTQAWAGTNEFAKTAAEFGTSFATTTGAGLLTGESLNDSVKQGLTSAAISTGTSIAQKQIASWKSAGDEVTTLADANKAAEAMAPKSANPNVELARDLEDFLPADQVMKGGRADSTTGSNGIADLAAKAKANLTPGDPSIMATPNYADARAINQAELDDWTNIVAKGGQGQLNTSTAAAPAPTIEAAAPTAAGNYPGVGGSLKQIGGGIADIAQGNFKQGFDQLSTGAGNLFMPSGPSPEQVKTLQDTPGFYSSEKNAFTPAGEAALRSITPNLLEKYGPATAAGIAGLALSGGFTPPDQPQSEQAKLLAGTPGEDLITKDADKYVVQNIPGVTYSPEGQILSATGAPSTISMQDVRVGPADYTATMQDVSRPTGSYAAAPMGPMQNQAPLMDPYQYYYQQYLAAQGQQPRYYAMGGITSLSAPMQAPPPAGIASLREGGNSNYPRRTGQIAGPGTEKSDSIPAMLSDGEFVMTAAAVRGMGKGSRREGAKRMYALMHQLEKNAARG
jgi:hypothetical protein